MAVAETRKNVEKSTHDSQDFIEVRDPQVRMVSFTGGRAVGERIQKCAGLKKLALELGSHCPALVMADADLDAAVEAIVSGAFWAGGQNCLHVQRVFVHESRYQDLICL